MSTPLLHPSNRRWELDALRGLMLVLMTLTHMPTMFSLPSGQPFGFVSAAEGFVFLSAYMAGRVYGKRARRDGMAAMQSAFHERALKLYLCQLALLLLAFTVIAWLGVHNRQGGITGLLEFFFIDPQAAVVGAASAIASAQLNAAVARWPRETRTSRRTARSIPQRGGQLSL